MNEFFKQVQQDISRIWAGLTRVQQMVFALVALASVVALAVLVMWAQTPEWSPLFTNLDDADAGQIVEKLKEAKVPYQVNGNAVMVPRSRVSELRLTMAAQGLPQGGTVGFSLFDKNQFGMTDSLQKINFQRALQGELARTIESLAPVENSRVHLVLPEKDLFADSAQEPSAAIVVKLKRGGKLTPEQAKTIVHLVAKSVEGLKDSNVVITDVEGRNYTDDLGLGREQNGISPELTLSQMDVKKQIEANLRRNLQGTLDRVLGSGNSVVSVAADLDFSQVETNEEVYSGSIHEGEASGSGMLVSSKVAREIYDGSGPTTMAGVPGMTSNMNGGANGALPTYQATGSMVGEAGRYEKSDEVRNFQPNKKVERKIKAPTEVKRLSVAVIVNGELEPQQLADLRQMISAAAGTDEIRGDTVVVTAQKFNDSLQKQEAEEVASARNQEQVQGYLKIGAGVLIGIIALVLLRRGLGGTATAEEDGPLELEGFNVDGRMAAPVSIGTVGEDDRKTHLQKEINKVVKTQPVEVARLVKSWMLEDD